MTSKKIALIDGYGLVFRAYFSLPPLTRNDGTPVGAVYGFTNMMIKLLAGLDVTHSAVVFDSGARTFRNDIYPEYKANRPPCPEDLKPQFAIVRQAAQALNLPTLEKIGFEADDIIATLAKKCEAEGYQVIIISSDKDLMQLIGDQVFMYDAMRDKFIGKPEVQEKFFVEPKKVLDVLSLIGDSSDNVPGVKGIGPKTAAELINQFGTLENLFAHLDQIKQDKRRQMLIEGAESAKLSKKLVTLDENVELGIALDELKIKGLEPHRLLAFLEEQGFRSLIARIKKEFSISDTAAVRAQFITHANALDSSIESSKPATGAMNRAPTISTPRIEGKKIPFSQVKKTAITSDQQIEKLYQTALDNGQITIDYQLENGEINFLSLATAKFDGDVEEIFYLYLNENPNHTESAPSTDLFGFSAEIEKTSEPQFNLKSFEKIFLNDSIKKIFFDAKTFLRLAPVNAYEDVSLINHLLNSAIKTDLHELIDMNLEESAEDLGFGEIFRNFTKKDSHKKSLETLKELLADEDKKIGFFTFRNFAIYQLYKIMAPQLAISNLNTAYLSFERPLLEVIAKMENVGVKIDVKKLHDLSQEFGQKIAKLTSEIYNLSGTEFNIASTQQLSEILFTKLGLTSGKKSRKTGALSTRSSVLEELADEGHEIAGKILEFRKFTKLKNTYTDSLPLEINKKTGRVHSNFSTISTITGRFSSNNPNLQNIPIRTLEGRKIRQCFIAEPGKMLISADYSQIELRVIAHVAKIGNLVQAFKADKDIHKITASQVFGVDLDQVSDEMRSSAKAINFGIIYGISAFGLAKQLNVPNQVASDYIKSYLTAYPGIDSYMRNSIEMARKNGYVQTISGRKCFIRGINDKNPVIRSEAERLAINAPIQGSAADIVKRAMLLINKKLAAEKMLSNLTLQIHDELIIESPLDELELAQKIVKSEMEKAVTLDAPLKVDVSVGSFWK
jgi:DNA polymerase-1